MKKLVGLLFIISLISGCTNAKKEEITKLGDEVIVLHDEMMPLMDDLYQTRMKLQQLADADSTRSGQDTVAELIQEIKLAEDAMMNWMRNFNPNFEGETDDETIAYLIGQKESMSQVAEQMNQALAAGKQRVNRQ
jgi:hypothetical protein